MKQDNTIKQSVRIKARKKEIPKRKYTSSRITPIKTGSIRIRVLTELEFQIKALCKKRNKTVTELLTELLEQEVQKEYNRNQTNILEILNEHK
jgi:hypothetical protein